MDDFHPAVNTAISYFASSNKTMQELASELGISRQAVQKRIAKASSYFQSFEKISTPDPKMQILEENLARLEALVLKLRRELVIAKTSNFLLSCLKERIKKFFPKFELKRFEPWEKKYLIDMFKKFQNMGGSLKDFCKAIGKSSETITKWQKAYEKYGISGLKDKTTRPHQFSHKMPLWIKEQLLILFLKFPNWSPYRYYKYVRNNPATNCAISIEAIKKLKYNHTKISEQEKQRIKKRWAFDPNYSVWSIDFTCIYKTPYYKLQLLTVSDQRSRFWFESALFLETSTDLVMDHLEELFIKYGKPFVIKADNGGEFRLDCRNQLKELSIYLLNSPVKYPKFCGAHERIHETLKGYISAFGEHRNITRLTEEINRFTNEYNHHWPHEYLEDKTPAEIYYSNPEYVPKDVEIITPYIKGGELRMKFKNRDGSQARLALPLIENPA